MPPERWDCPHCGQELAASARFCPECGSDGETGWGENADHVGVLDDASPGPDPQPPTRAASGAGRPWIVVGAVAALAGFLLVVSGSISLGLQLAAVLAMIVLGWRVRVVSPREVRERPA